MPVFLVDILRVCNHRVCVYLVVVVLYRRACPRPYIPPPPHPKILQRIRGGLLGDGISSFLSSLMTSMPNTTFSQNNGVIALTRCASRRAGIACACWLIVFGILAKVCVCRLDF